MRSADDIMVGIIDCYRDIADLDQWAEGFEKNGAHRAGSKGEVAWLVRTWTSRQDRLNWFRTRDERDGEDSGETDG